MLATPGRIFLGCTAITGYVPIMSKHHQCAVFGAGCYWGSEAAFRAVPGVVDSAVGFMGDSLCCTDAPSSDEESKALCLVEVVRVEFDPDQVTYSELLETFWCCHDATRSSHRPEDGRPPLERSVLFVIDDEQRSTAETARGAVVKSARFAAPVTTTIEPATHFHRAHESEQRYLERNEGVVCSAKRPAMITAEADAAE